MMASLYTFENIYRTKEVKEFKVYGRFEGDDWVHILKKIINAHDEQSTTTLKKGGLNGDPERVFV